jgi:hypothetical protein
MACLARFGFSFSMRRCNFVLLSGDHLLLLVIISKSCISSSYQHILKRLSEIDMRCFSNQTEWNFHIDKLSTKTRDRVRTLHNLFLSGYRTSLDDNRDSEDRRSPFNEDFRFRRTYRDGGVSPSMLTISGICTVSVMAHGGNIVSNVSNSAT